MATKAKKKASAATRKETVVSVRSLCVSEDTAHLLDRCVDRAVLLFNVHPTRATDFVLNVGLELFYRKLGKIVLEHNLNALRKK